MNVEHEYFLVSSLPSLQRVRSRSGTRCFIACAKSALTSTASAGRTLFREPHADRLAALEHDLVDRRIELDAHAHAPRE